MIITYGSFFKLYIDYYFELCSFRVSVYSKLAENMFKWFRDLFTPFWSYFFSGMECAHHNCLWHVAIFCSSWLSPSFFPQHCHHTLLATTYFSKHSCLWILPLYSQDFLTTSLVTPVQWPWTLPCLC